jgi:ankyrin repeat protein
MQIVTMILDRFADPGQSAENGWTPLHIAAQNGHDEVRCELNVLLLCGASYSEVHLAYTLFYLITVYLC